ncbi:MAG: hydrogenase maturation protease [bacterium]
MKSILIYGYGNPGRQDDGVGPALVEALELWQAADGVSVMTLETNYQLNAEDALTVAGHDQVIFADATREGDAPFTFRRLLPDTAVSFSTHAMRPESILALADELYGKSPKTYLLTIRGYEWEPNEPMTRGAVANLAAALDFLKLNPF